MPSLFSLPEPTRLCDLAFNLNDAIHEYSRCNDNFGIKLAELNDLVHTSYGAAASHCHDRAKIACGLVIGKVAPAVTALRLDQCQVAVDWVFQYMRLPVDDPYLLALRQRRAVSGRRIERGDARTGGANALCQISLGHQL